MEYQVEELSSTEIKINVQVPANEIDQAINKAVDKLKKNLVIDGYRKGKVPNSIIEKRYFDDVITEALDTMLQAHTDQILDKIDYFPATNAKYDGEVPKKSADYSYTLTLDVLPKVALPDLSKVSIEEKKVVVTDSEVNELVENIHKSMAVPAPLAEERPVLENDFVVLSFEGTDNGVVVEGLKVEFFTLKLGQNAAPVDFEKLIVGMKKGEKNAGPVYFDLDFPDKNVAGKTIQISIELHDIQDQKLPPLDDEIAKINGFDTLEAMREEIRKNIQIRKEREYKIKAIDQMMNKILEPLSFEIPRILLERQKRDFLLSEKRRLDLEGRAEEDVTAELAKLETVAEEKSQRTAKSQVLLLIYAFTEKMSVTEREIDMRIYQQAQYAGEDFQKLRNIVWQTQMVSELRDKILCDKAMDFIYSQVQKIYVD